MYNRILNKIDAVQDFNAAALIPLQLENCTGYVPRDHADVYKSSGFFTYENDTFRFIDAVTSFDDRTKALTEIKNDLVTGHYLKPEKFDIEWRPVGKAEDRTQNPALLVQREYWQNFGFEADAAYALVTVAQDNETKIWLQKRAGSVVAPNTYDLAVGGALMYPDTIRQTLKKEAAEEAALDIDALPVKSLGTTSLSHTMTGKATRLTHHLHHIELPPTHKLQSGNVDEVAGFETVSVRDVIEMASDGRFAAVVVQTLMTSLWQADLLPKAKDYSALVSRLQKYHRPAI